MAKSLAELRQQPPARAERSVVVCLAPHLVAEVQALTGELDDIALAGRLTRRGDTDGDDAGPPPRMGDGEDPRADEIRARLAELLEEMGQHEGEVRLRAVDDGEWRRWVNAHPARPEGEPGHDRDLEVSRGYCNADDLIDDLGTYATAWNDELLGEDGWGIIASRMAGPDKKRCATAVVSMHEQAMDLGKWRAGLSATLRKSPVVGQPAPQDTPPAST